MKKPLIFDFDGVIADSFDITYDILKKLIPSATKEQFKASFNTNIQDVQYEGKKIRENGMIEKFSNEYVKRAKDIGINPTVKNALKTLHADFELFIVSSSANRLIESYLELHDISHVFTQVLGLDIERSKVKKFNMIFETYDYTPKDSAFVSDTYGDIHEAHEANIDFTVGILGGYQDEETLKQAKPHAIVKDFNELVTLMQNRF